MERAGGRMTDAQRSRLKRWRNFQALRTAGFLLALLGLLYIGSRVIVGMGEGFEPLLALALLVWTLWLSMAPAAWLAAQRDMKLGQADILEGEGYLQPRRGFALLAPTRAVLIVGSRRFDISDGLAGLVRDGEPVRVTFGRQSGALVDVAPLSENTVLWTKQ